MSKALATKNVAAVLLALALVAGFAFAFASPAKADTISGLQAQVQALLAQIAALQGPSSGGSASSGACFTFTQNLKLGSSGGEVVNVQKFLNGHGFQIAASGAGSPGNETSRFGAKTKAAVIAFQNANKADTLTPVGLSAGTGNWGPSTRAKANAICAGAPGTPSSTTTPTPTPTGPGITVSAAAQQPANTLAPQGSSRVPFTAFTLTNNTNQTVTISSVTVQRAGLAQDAAFSGVVLLDSNGLQVGIAHTFNSNHQTNVGDTFTLAPGASMTYTVAANMAASLSSYTGQVAQLQVVGINTTVPISGSLPISGAQQTLNSTLSIGSVSTSTSSFDPGAAQTKNLGDKAVRFSGLRFTAGSTEDLMLNSVRWRQVGTASASDISNVVTVVNGTSYPSTVDSSGKYYTTVFPGGILIGKGNSVDVYVQGDLSGSNAASRTVELDIDKVTDVYFVGQLYGYGIAPSGTYTPWFVGYKTTIQGGSATAVQNATSVASQNIPLSVQNTPLGGFQTNFQGEPVSVTAIKLSVATSSGATGGYLTNVSIADENGLIVAGPVDASGVGTTLSFTDTVTFKTGLHTYTVKGKVPSAWANSSTVTLSTTPSSQWTSPTGQVTGNSVTLPSSTVTMNQMTIQAGSLAITAGTNPVAATIVAGVVQQTLGTIQLDAAQSGEDIRFASLPVSIIVSATANAANLNSCLIYDGSTALNNNTVVNPSSSTTDTTNTTTAKNTFTFDNSITVAKGTVKILTVKCNIVSGASLTSAQIGVHASNTYAATGVQSGASITPTATTGTSGSQTITASGTLTATADSTAVSQPSLTLVPAGTAGVIQGSVKLHAANEAINVTKIGLTLANGTYGSASTGASASSNSGVNDVVVTSILNGSTIVGTVTFTGTGQTATSTLTTPINVPQDSDVFLTIKTDLAAIGVSAPGGIGDTVKVDPLNIQANGVSSGTQINISATAGVKGVQVFKSVPTVVNNSAVSCSNSSSPVCNGTSQVLKNFTVKADAAGAVGVEQLKFFVSTSSANVTNLVVQVLDQNGIVSTSTFGTTQCSSGCTAGQSAGTSAVTIVGGPVLIPANTTYTFKLLGDVAPSATTWSVNTKIKGDGSAIAGIGSSPATIGTTTAVANADTNSNFIWSDNATTTAGLTTKDWFNGFQVTGLNGSAGF